MGLGLTYPLSLKDNISLWVKQLKSGLLLIRTPSEDEAHEKIRERGYSIDSAVQKLSHILLVRGIELKGSKLDDT